MASFILKHLSRIHQSFELKFKINLNQVEKSKIQFVRQAGEEIEEPARSTLHYDQNHGFMCVYDGIKEWLDIKFVGFQS